MARDIGGNLLQGCVVLPVTGTRGGATIFWDKQIVDITDQIIASFSITAKVRIISTGHSFWMTTIYGPTDDQQKANFLSELAVVAPAAPEPWMLNDDFNMIYQARDKNNSNLNLRMMRRFRDTLNRSELKEINYLAGGSLGRMSRLTPCWFVWIGRSATRIGTSDSPTLDCSRWPWPCPITALCS